MSQNYNLPPDIEKQLLSAVDPANFEEQQLRLLKEKEEQAAKDLTTILDTTKARNTISVKEFQKFIPIFKSLADSGLSEEEYNRRGEEYYKRIDLNTPLTIVDDDGKFITQHAPQFREIVPLADDPGNVVGHYIKNSDSDITAYRQEAHDAFLSTFHKNQNFGTIPDERMEVAKSIIHRELLKAKVSGVPLEKITLDDMVIDFTTKQITLGNGEVINMEQPQGKDTIGPTTETQGTVKDAPPPVPLEFEDDDD